MADDLQPKDVLPIDPSVPAPRLAFPVVGISTSAEGLEALRQMFRALPADTGMGFVVVSELAPEDAPRLAEILASSTAMRVSPAGDEGPVERNHVYFVPPGQEMILAGGRFGPASQSASRLPGSEQFFRSLAQGSVHQAVGVVLAGRSGDSAVGLKEIKAAGGVTFAQQGGLEDGCGGFGLH